MNRAHAIEDIQFVRKYSDRVSGSCNHAYMGSIAQLELARKLGATTSWPDTLPFNLLMADATDEQIQEARAYVDTYMEHAQEYFSIRGRLSRIKEALS